VESPFASKVEEAFNGPLTERMELTVEEALEIKPENIELPATVKVLEADNGPATCKEAATVEEAEEINPVLKLVKPPKDAKPLVLIESAETELVAYKSEEVAI